MANARFIVAKRIKIIEVLPQSSDILLEIVNSVNRAKTGIPQVEKKRELDKDKNNYIHISPQK